MYNKIIFKIEMIYMIIIIATIITYCNVINDIWNYNEQSKHKHNKPMTTYDFDLVNNSNFKQ